jgi:hypothetical protein
MSNLSGNSIRAPGSKIRICDEAKSLLSNYIRTASRVFSRDEIAHMQMEHHDSRAG